MSFTSKRSHILVHKWVLHYRMKNTDMGSRIVLLHRHTRTIACHFDTLCCNLFVSVCVYVYNVCM